MLSKKQLAIRLSKLHPFKNPDIQREQYSTPSELAATLIHFAYMQDDIAEKRIADLGCGTGILGIGAGILQAKHVTFLDIDKQALETLKENIPEGMEHTIIHAPIRAITGIDVVIMNPPFGTKQRHADKQFLLAAMKTAPVIYSIHLKGSEEFIDQLCSTYHYERTHTLEEEFRIHATMSIHKKPQKYIGISIIRLQQRL